MSFIQLFKKAIAENQGFQLWTDTTQTQDIQQATMISFPFSHQKLKLSDNSGYGKYDTLAVLFFYLHKDLDHPSYLQQCSAKEIGSVSFMERRDLLDFIAGKTASAKVDEKTAQDVHLFGFDLSHKRVMLGDVRSDVENIKRIKTLHRTINTASNVLCIQGQKNFRNIEKTAYASFFKPAKPVVPEKVEKDSKKIPIIIVPAAAQSLLNLYNVKEFLIDSQF
jgi:parafibromin